MFRIFREMKARRMNKIVDEVRQQLIEEMSSVTIEVKRELESFVIHKTNDVTIDYRELAGHIDYYDVAEHIDESEVANYISDSDIAYHIDAYDVASAIDVDDIAQHFDSYTLAQEIDISDIAHHIDLDNSLDDVRRDILSEVEDMVSDALDSLEITRG